MVDYGGGVVAVRLVGVIGEIESFTTFLTRIITVTIGRSGRYGIKHFLQISIGWTSSWIVSP